MSDYILKNYKLKMRTQAPIHIGDGSQYDGMTSFEHARNFITLDSHSLFKALNEAGIDVSEFSKWVIEEKSERDYRKPRIADFIRSKYPARSEEIVQALLRTGKTKLENLSLTRIYSDIATCLKNADNKPYIPGSEIKGAVVTAIMYDWLNNNKKFIDDLRKILEENRAFLEEVYESLKSVKILTERKKDSGYQNYLEIDIPKNQEREFRRILSMRERPINYIKQDLIKRMKFSPDRVDEICRLIEQWRSGDKKTYKNKIRDQQKRYNPQKINFILNQLDKLEQHYWNNYLALSPSTEDIIHKLMRFLRISDSNAPAHSKITNCKIIHTNSRITMDLFFEIIDDNVIFESDVLIEKNDLAIEEIGFSSNKSAILDINNICKSIYNFADRIIQEDIDYVENLPDTNYRFPVNEIKAQLNELKMRNRPDSPLLRIGKGQGFLSLTLALLIKDQDREIYSKLLGVVQSNKNNPDNYPITRRIFTDGTGKYKLPGWIKLSFEEVSA